MREMRVLLLAGVLAASACGRAERENGTAAGDSARVAADSAAAVSLLTPIRGLSMAEVEFGDMAALSAGDPAIRQYGQTVAADHRALISALDSVARLHSATLVERRETQELANTARMAHSGLDDVVGAEFDLPFVRAEVESHRLLLDQLDQQLIPSASHADLRSLLTDIRAMADAHQTRARQLLAQQLGQSEESEQPLQRQPRRRPPAGEPVTRPDTGRVPVPPPDTGRAGSVIVSER
jgi:predicted outer membrane protein